MILTCRLLAAFVALFLAYSAAAQMPPRPEQRLRDPQGNELQGNRPQNLQHQPPGPKAAPGKSQADCPSTCVEGLTRVFFPHGNACQLHFSIPCFPGACAADGKSCAIKCTSNKQCGPNAVCTTANVCAPNLNSCHNEHTMKTGDGSLYKCDPYPCKGGACVGYCATDLDCSKGFTCKGTACVPG